MHPHSKQAFHCKYTYCWHSNMGDYFIRTVWTVSKLYIENSWSIYEQLAVVRYHKECWKALYVQSSKTDQSVYPCSLASPYTVGCFNIFIQISPEIQNEQFQIQRMPSSLPDYANSTWKCFCLFVFVNSAYLID